MSDIESKDTDVVLEDAQLNDNQREAKALELKLKGNKKFTAKDYNSAIDLYSQAISMYDKAEFFGNRAAAYMLIENYPDALKDCTSALKLDDKYKKAYIRGIKCHSEMGEYKQAKKFAQIGLTHYPSDYELRRSLSRIEIIVQKLYKIDEKLAKVSLKYNALYEQQLISTMTSNIIDTEMKIDTNTNNNNNNDSNSKAHHPIHKISDKDLRDVEIALSIINNLLKSELSSNIDLKCTKIRALIIKQDNVAALSMATALLRYKPSYVPIMKLRAIALFRNNNVPSAVKHMQTVLRSDPDNDHCSKLFKLFRSIPRLKEAANIAVKNGDLEDAIAKYSECLASDPINHTLNSIIYANRATIWLKKNDYQSAYDDCCMSLELQPGYLKAICRRFKALMGLKRFDEAVGDAERAVKLHPHDQQFRQMLRTAKIELKKSKRKDYYQILGVGSGASEHEIKKGFRKKAMIWHPDKFASGTEDDRLKAEEKFKEIGEAYEVLKDEKMKAQYDNGADLEEIKQGSHSHFPGGHVDISQIFDLLGGGGGFGGMGGFPGMSSGGRGRGGQTFTFRFG